MDVHAGRTPARRRRRAAAIAVGTIAALGVMTASASAAITITPTDDPEVVSNSILDDTTTLVGSAFTTRPNEFVPAPNPEDEDILQPAKTGSGGHTRHRERRSAASRSRAPIPGCSPPVTRCCSRTTPQSTTIRRTARMTSRTRARAVEDPDTLERSTRDFRPRRHDAADRRQRAADGRTASRSATASSRTSSPSSSTRRSTTPSSPSWTRPTGGRPRTTRSSHPAISPPRQATGRSASTASGRRPCSMPRPPARRSTPPRAW